MDAIEFLERQHREVEDLFDQLEEADDGSKRQLADEIIRKLEHHTAIEEEIFYPRVRADIPELGDDILEDLEEHHAVELLLQEWSQLQPGDERFAAKAEVIEEMVEHHVEEEEDELFPQVRSDLPGEVLDQLGRRMAERFEQLEAGARTKGDLYERARELDVEGRSQMTKDELAEAVQRSRS